MPLYEYDCDGCGRRFELIRKFSDPPVDTCPHCGGKVHKLFSSPAIQFKGSGFYITDYAKKDHQSGTASGESKSDSGSKDKGEAGAKSESSEKGDKPAQGDATTKSEKAPAKAEPAVQPKEKSKPGT